MAQTDRLLSARAPVVSGATFLAETLREELVEARHPPGVRLYNLRELQALRKYSSKRLLEKRKLSVMELLR